MRRVRLRELKKRDLDFGPLRTLWATISNDRLLEYRHTIPPEWDVARPAVEERLTGFGMQETIWTAPSLR